LKLLTFVQTGQANHFRFAATARSDYAIDRYVAETKRLYSVLETRLSSHPWLAGEKYTIADIATFSWVRIAEFIELSLDEFPTVQKWAERIKEREASKKGITLPASLKTWEEGLEWFAAGRRRIDAMQNADKY
jgi:glutathione S-transferase